MSGEYAGWRYSSILGHFTGFLVGMVYWPLIECGNFITRLRQQAKRNDQFDL